MISAPRIMIYCPLCKGKLMAQKAIAEGTWIPCPLCSRDFRFTSLKNHRSEPLVVPYVDDAISAKPAAAPKAVAIATSETSSRVVPELVLEQPPDNRPSEIVKPLLEAAPKIASMSSPVPLPPIAIAPVGSVSQKLIAVPHVADVGALTLEIEPEAASKPAQRMAVARAANDRRVVALPPSPPPKPVVPNTMAAQFYLAAVPEDQVPKSRMMYYVAGIAALLTITFLSIVMYPIVREKYWPTEELISSNNTDPEPVASPDQFPRPVVEPYRRTYQPPTDVKPVDFDELRAKRALEAAANTVVLQEREAARVEQEAKLAEAATALKKITDEKLAHNAELRQLANDLAAEQREKLEAARAAKRKLMLNKVKSATTFMHDQGQADYDKAMREMNSAQDDYNYNNKTAPTRTRVASLNQVQDKINTAFKHGLESYDYLIQKKVAQLDAALAIDVEGMLKPEKDRVKAMLEEGRWLTQSGALAWWLGGSLHPRGANWYANATVVTVKDLYKQDRSSEVSDKQKKSDEKFSK